MYIEDYVLMKGKQEVVVFMYWNDWRLHLSRFWCYKIANNDCFYFLIIEHDLFQINVVAVLIFSERLKIIKSIRTFINSYKKLPSFLWFVSQDYDKMRK